jgi:hypothetical protein
VENLHDWCHRRKTNRSNLRRKPLKNRTEVKKLNLDIYKAMEKRGHRGVRNNGQETYATIQDYAKALGVTLMEML